MKILKIVGAVFGAIIALLAIAAVIIWVTFDPNDYKDYIARWVSERTGREFVIEDDLELTFFPWLGVTTGNVSLGNAAGFGDDPFAAIETLTVRVRLMPLLRRQVEIGTVRLDGLELNLSTSADGRNNWADLTSAPSAASTDAAPSTGEAPFLQSLNIAGIDINNGLIFFRSNATEVRYVISELNAETGAIAPGRPVDGELTFRLVGVDPQLTADVTASGRIAIATPTASIEASGLRVGFNLADGRGAERATGSLELDRVSVASDGATIAVTRGNLTAMLVDPPLGPAETEAQIDWTSASVDRAAATLDIEGLTASVAGIVARLELRGADVFTEPTLAGSVRIVDQPIAAALDAFAIAIDGVAGNDLGRGNLEASFQVDATARTATVTGVIAQALGATARGEVSIAGDRSIDARIATDTFDPAQVLALMPSATRERIDAAALGSVGLSARVRYAAESGDLSMTDLEVAVLDSRLTGAVARRDAGRRFDGNVVVNPIAAERLVAVLGDVLPEALPPAALGQVALSATFDYSIDARTLSLTEVEARAADIDVLGAVRVADLGGSPAWNGDVEVLNFDPEALMIRLERPLSARSDPATLGRARGSAHVEGDSSRLSASNLRVVLDDSTITGEVTMRLADTPDYRFDLTIDRLNADRYLPPAEDAPPEGAAAVAADVALPTEPLARLKLDGRFNVGELRVAGLRLENVGASLSAGDSRGVIEQARARLYGGEFQGRVELDATAELPRLAVDGTVTELAIEPLLSDLRGEANMTGTGNFDMTLAGTGTELSNVLESAQGRVSFSVRDGVLRGFDLGRTMCSAFNATQSLPRPASSAAPQTQYQLMRGGADVIEGIARTEDLEATMAFMRVSGRGQSALVSREINYDLVATLTSSIAIERCQSMDRLIGDSVPVKVTGTILEPEIAPDYGEILRNRIRDELQDRLRERLFN